MIANHILHVRPNGWSVDWRLECLPGEGHFTADIDEWTEDADTLEANGINVDRTRCWVHDYIDNAYDIEEWMRGNDWPEDGPWPVRCWFDGGLVVEYVAIAATPPPRVAGTAPGSPASAAGSQPGARNERGR